jgi:hypothetical protein
MSERLKQYLLEAYSGDRVIMPEKPPKEFPIQIDDQDDNDPLSEICIIFVTVKGYNRFILDLCGRIVISGEISDLAEIYNGFADKASGRVVLNLSLQQIEAVSDLAKLIRKTTITDGPEIDHVQYRISARTISSLYRFVRILKEYIKTKRSGL